jgi:TRAP-type transport system small permease protein
MLVPFQIAAAILVLGLALIMDLQVFQRYVVGRSLGWPDELAGIMLAWITFVGAVLAMRDEEHIGFTLLEERLPASWALAVRGLCDLIVVAFLGVLIYYSIPLIERTWNQTPITVPIPRGAIYLVLPVSAAFMIYYRLARSPVIRRLLGRPRDDRGPGGGQA